MSLRVNRYVVVQKKELTKASKDGFASTKSNTYPVKIRRGGKMGKGGKQKGKSQTSRMSRVASGRKSPEAIMKEWNSLTEEEQIEYMWMDYAVFLAAVKIHLINRSR